MECEQIIMNYTVPPSSEDLESLAKSVMENLPDELQSHCKVVSINVEDMADDATQVDLELEDQFDLAALYKSGKEISPGIERKIANDDDVLILYRRVILDIWCETEGDLLSIIRQIIIEELGRYFEFCDDDVIEMLDRHYQGML